MTYDFSGKSDRQVLADIGNRPEPKVMRTPSKRYSRRSSSMECNPSGEINAVTCHHDISENSRSTEIE